MESRVRPAHTLKNCSTTDQESKEETIRPKLYPTTKVQYPIPRSTRIGRENCFTKENLGERLGESHMNASPSLEIMEEDSRDLANIFESISPNDVPPQMQIMWEIKKNSCLHNLREVTVGTQGISHILQY